MYCSTHRRLVTALESNKPNQQQLKKLPPILPSPTFAPSVKVRKNGVFFLVLNDAISELLLLDA